jgi:lipopolysaccharide heptosyltransferase I
MNDRPLHSLSSSHPSLLVLRLSALGDVIHTIPAVAALRASHPNLAWVVETPYRELVELVAGVDAIPVRMKTWGRDPIRSRAAIAAAFRAIRGADVSIDFQGLVKSSALGRLSGARRRYGFAANAIREKPALLFTNRWVKVDTTKHVVEQNLELAAHVGQTLLSVRAGGTDKSVCPTWNAFPADPENKLEAFRDAIVLLPGAGRPEKLWPVERFRDLAAQIGAAALALWGPGEEELAARIGARVAPPTNLRELAFVLRHAKAVVGADTGPLHLAAALGTPVVGLFGPTNPRRNGPHGQLEHCVNRFDTTKLMDSITVPEVMTMLEQVVRR